MHLTIWIEVCQVYNKSLNAMKDNEIDVEKLIEKYARYIMNSHSLYIADKYIEKVLADYPELCEKVKTAIRKNV